ncbi:uncharacterized protein LOC117647717 [Thrips palmi]|uniref:Uncharacterized protein LOC117647717 n=1 Tax=Thrips palmi TaxID=161013 RepID=A0A6P8Z6E0_THRPL|nr:uncharacterized protein LOC117647717 [Thrips palmi]
MPPKKHPAVEGKAGPSRGSSRGAPSARASSSRARGGRRAAARGRGASSSGGNMGDTFLGKLVTNPGVMGDFMKFYGTLAKALEKRDKKKTAQRLGFGGDDDDSDDDDEDSSDSHDSDSGEESPGDDLDGFARRALSGMAAKMGGVSDLKFGEARLDRSSDEDSDEDDSDTDHEMNEMVYVWNAVESSSSEDEAEQAQPGTARVKYVRFRDEEFAAAVAAATRIPPAVADPLMRTRKEDDFFCDVKKDKHIEAVLKALGNGTKDVAALHLEDAQWATCKMYSPLLVKLLASYKESLRTLSMTNRLLLQPNNGKKKDCIWKVVSSMPHLEELRLTYMPLSLHYYTYRGELSVDDRYGLPSTKTKQAPAALPALKRLHLHLTTDWFQQQFRAAIDGGPDYEDFEYESAGGGEREEEQEDFLDVAALHLEDAQWATCKMYSPLLVKLLASYKESLRTLSMTNRLLLQPNNGKKKDCIWKVVSSMPHLEELRLTYMPLSLHYYTYRGELSVDDRYGLPSTKTKQAPAALPALKRLHLHLTTDWFQQQFRAAIDGGPDYEDFEYESAGGGEREEEQEDFLVTCWPPRGTPATRWSRRRPSSPGPPATWAGLKQLTFKVPSKAPFSLALFAKAPEKLVRKAQASWNQVLTAVAGVCCSLKCLTLEGCGWSADALHPDPGQEPFAEEGVLDENPELEPRHLALLKDLAALKRVQLSPTLRRAAKGSELATLVAQCQEEWARRGVGVQWGKKAADSA